MHSSPKCLSSVAKHPALHTPGGSTRVMHSSAPLKLIATPCRPPLSPVSPSTQLCATALIRDIHSAHRAEAALPAAAHAPITDHPYPIL